jgi:hypothetical protein
VDFGVCFFSAQEPTFETDKTKGKNTMTVSDLNAYYSAVDFITLDQSRPDYPVATIDGAAMGFSPGETVQLMRARVQESGFDWAGSKVKEIVIKHVTLDGEDVLFLVACIHRSIKIRLFDSAVSVWALYALHQLLPRLKTKVIPGSSIELNKVSSPLDFGLLQRAKDACKNIGFTVSFA